MTERASVPCGSCHDCCQGNELVGMTEHDDPTSYETELVSVGGQVFEVLKRHPNGDCIYLDRATGCTIHGRAPHTCQIFDCRLAYLRYKAIPRAERRRRDRIIPGQREAMKNAARVLAEHPLPGRTTD